VGTPQWNGVQKYLYYGCRWGIKTKRDKKGENVKIRYEARGKARKEIPELYKFLGASLTIG